MRALPFAMLLVGTVLIAADVSPQSIEREDPSATMLEKRIPGGAVEDMATLDAFSMALNYGGVPGGIIRVRSCEEDGFKQPFESKGLKLRQVLDSIAAADSRYRWKLEDGTINILPQYDEPELLKTRIAYFRVDDVDSAEVALGSLLALPEVKRAMNALGLNHGLVLLVSPMSPRPSKFSVNCKGASLRGVLNCIARAQGRAIWDYLETHCNGRNEVVIKF